MKVEVDEQKNIILREAYSGVGLLSDDKEFLGICMRDSGFEFTYGGYWYSAKEGKLECIGKDPHTGEDGKQISA